jgi:uncharacterized protein YciI
MPHRTLVLFSTGPAWAAGRDSRQQAHWLAHAAFIDGLTERGLLVAGGPFGDQSGALNILACSPDKLDVRALYASDPFVVHGMFVLERIVPWVVFVDNWAQLS